MTWRRSAWRSFLRAHYQIVRKLDSELLSQEGMSLSAFEVLRWLERESAGRMRMSELANRVMLSRSGVTRLVDSLVAEGLVTRERCLGDARGTEAVLTEAGALRLAVLSESHFETVRQVFIDLLEPSDLANLVDVLGKVVEPEDPADRC